MMDSVFVVAFYTDKIFVTGGPESTPSLPGKDAEVVPPTEDKKSGNASLLQAIRKGSSDWKMEDKYLCPMIG